MNWQDVQKLRKAGQIDQALNTAIEILQADPGDFKTRSQYQWVIFDCIKLIVSHMDEAIKRNQRVDGRDVEDLMSWMREFRAQEPEVPGMVVSMIVGQLAKVGQHLPKFVAIIAWVGIEGFRSEDWEPQEYQGKTFPSLVMKVARTLCKSVKVHPEPSQKSMSFTLAFAEQVRDKAKQEDTIWLEWDMAIVLRRMGDIQRATEVLASVIKAKRNEFWVWAEAARLYQSEQPELAVACFCRALECPAEQKFLVRVHRELAMLLAEQGEYAQASQEVALTINIRQTEGWPLSREMEEMIAASWYDPAADGAEKPEAFYAEHSPAALALCFDVVETKEANFLGTLVRHAPKDPRPGWKPKPLLRYAIKDSKGQAWSIVGPSIKGFKVEVGAPLLVIVGSQNGDDKQTIVHASSRKDGRKWDSMESGVGVVMREATAEKPMKILILISGEEVNISDTTRVSFGIGAGVRFGFARNPKNNRIDIFNLERGDLPENDFKRVKGELRRSPKGFGFVDDVFVPPNLVSQTDSDEAEVATLAVNTWNPKKGCYGWRAISLDSA